VKSYNSVSMQFHMVMLLGESICPFGQTK